jgi:hypothetical protein
MPLDHAFTHHLHELMVEVGEAVAEPEAKYKAELIWKAQQTHNSAAIPVAYRDAALHALQTRFDKTVERYLQASVEWGIPILAFIELRTIIGKSEQRLREYHEITNKKLDVLAAEVHSSKESRP